MRQMQLIKPGGLNNLKLVDVEPPRVKADEILIKVVASSLNYHDLMVALGQIPTEDRRVLLGDASGEVVETGSDVSRWQIGDKVMSACFPRWIEGRPNKALMSFIGDHENGYATEYIALPETAVTRMPGNWSLIEAATLPCACLTAWRALVDEGDLKAGESVLVQGSGGVSVFALQLAKSMGAHVVATSSSDEKLERLRDLGADELINYRNTPEWGREVLARTGKAGVDHVIEVGGGGTFSQSVTAASFGGHIALIGVLSGPSASDIVLPRIFMKQVRTSGIAMANHQSQNAMVDYLEKSDLRPVISDTFELADLATAFQHQKDNKHFGKISITLS